MIFWIVFVSPLLLALVVIYVLRRVAKQKQHLERLQQAMIERKEKEAEQSRLEKERSLSPKIP